MKIQKKKWGGGSGQGGGGFRLGGGQVGCEWRSEAFVKMKIQKKKKKWGGGGGGGSGWGGVRVDVYGEVKNLTDFSQKLIR